MLQALEGAEVANVRQYMETVLLQLLRRRPALLHARVLPRLRDGRSSGSHALPSLILAAARAAALGLVPSRTAAAATEARQGLARSAQPPHEEWLPRSERQPDRREPQQPQLQGHVGLRSNGELLLEVADAVTPWALSHVHALRTFAQLVLWRMHELLPTLAARDPTAAALLRFFRRAE